MATSVIGTSVSAAQLKDLFRQIDEGSITGTIIQAVLERQNPFHNFVTPDEVKTRSTINSSTIADMIFAGNYDFVDENIIIKKFLFEPLNIGEWDFRVISAGKSVSSKEAKALCEEDGWQTAALEHLLIFGFMFPEAQRKNPIIALGSGSLLNGSRLVPGPLDDFSRRRLNLDCWERDWNSGCRFLSVRKVSKPE
jgi:hypothetical protein